MMPLKGPCSERGARRGGGDHGIQFGAEHQLTVQGWDAQSNPRKAKIVSADQTSAGKRENT
eukprot:3905582-Rhodomonas_salina.3